MLFKSQGRSFSCGEGIQGPVTGDHGSGLCFISTSAVLLLAAHQVGPEESVSTALKGRPYAGFYAEGTFTPHFGPNPRMPKSGLLNSSRGQFVFRCEDESG